eukprot:13872615-Ditylum_brightwellii.AAC.1
MSFLELAVHDGLIKKEGSSYRFSHDQLQLAAYSLVPEDETCLWHLQIGQHIWENASEKDKDKVIFIAVDQMNRGLALLESDDQKEHIAKLNLRAGEKAMSLSTFSSSALYFGAGILTLVEKATRIILSKAESPSDKVRAYFILVKA